MINGRLYYPIQAFFLGMAFMLPWLATLLQSHGQTNLAPVYRETPDPYFNPKQQIDQDALPGPSTSSLSRSALLKPIQEKSAQRYFNQSEFSAPKTEQTGDQTGENKTWEPPRLRPRGSHPSVIDSAESAMGNRVSNSSTSAPEFSSIIRQPKADQNTNSMPLNQLVSPPVEKEYAADLSRLKRPFEVISGTKLANPFFDPTGSPKTGELASYEKARQNQAIFGETTEQPIREFALPGDEPIQGLASPIQAGFISEDVNSTHQQSIDSAATENSKRESKKQPERELFEPTRLLARVGDQPIFLGDLMFDINQLIERVIPTAPPDIKKREIQKAIPIVLNKHVEQALIYVDTLQKLPEQVDINSVLEQAGKEFDTKAVLEMAQQVGVNNTAEFDAILRMQGSSLRRLRLGWSKEQIARYFLMQELDTIDEITHQELLKEYQRRQEEFAVPAKVRWEEIMVRFDRAGSRSAAEKTIVDMGNKIVFGANFASVAKSSSHGFTAQDGGVHNWTSRGALVHESLDNALFSLPLGELSDKIQSSIGFHIIRVLERTEANHQPFTEVQVEIKAQLEDQKREQNFQQHMQKLKDKIEVEYFLGTDLDNPFPAGGNH